MEHEEYLKLMLSGKKIKLEYLLIEHQKNIAVYETKRDLYTDEINSIEKQLHYKDKK